MCARAHCRYVLPRLIKYLRKCDRGLYLSSRTSISVNVCTVRSSCRMLSNFNSPSICFSPCLVFLFYIRFGGEKNLVSIKINATKFVSVFVLLACIIVSFLFSRASHHGFQVYSSWERCFFHSLLFSLSLSREVLASSLRSLSLLRLSSIFFFLCRPCLELSDERGENQWQQFYSPTYNSKSGFSLSFKSVQLLIISCLYVISNRSFH